jgi:chromosome segregation ATPase
MTEINEVTMKEFFQGVVDKVAELSTQAGKVEALEQRVNDLYSRITDLEQQNAGLRADLNGATNTIQELNGKLEASETALSHERSVSQGLREAITSRDSSVVELQRQLDDTNRSLHGAVNERDAARNEVSDLKAMVESVRESLNKTTEDRDHWQNEARRLQDIVNDLEVKLSRINSILSPPHPVVASVA